MAYWVDKKYRLLLELAAVLREQWTGSIITTNRTKMTITLPAQGFDEVIEKALGDEIGGGIQESINGLTFEVTANCCNSG